MKFLKEFSNESNIVNDALKVKNAARAFVIDKFKNIALLNYSGEYRGKQFSFYTTPGGGLEENETPEIAVKREVLEEIGYECNILHEVEVIIDYYCDQPRKTITNYFIVEPLKMNRINWTESEKQYIKEIKWVDIEVAEEILTRIPHDSIGQIIQRRDLYALMEVKKIIDIK